MKRCWIVAKASLLIALLSGRKAATDKLCERSGGALGCVGEGGGVAVSEWRGFASNCIKRKC